MITQEKFLSRGDIWFDEKPEKLPNVDALYYYSQPTPPPIPEKDAAENQMLGRANRYHRWQDILKFKSLGVLTYDLGGLYTNPTSQHLLNINKFKDEFGGERVRQFNWRYGITIKGKLFLLLRKMLISSPK